jgi:hypothetical protein
MSANRLLGLILVFSPLSILSIGGGQAAIPEIQHQTVMVHGNEPPAGDRCRAPALDAPGQHR